MDNITAARGAGGDAVNARDKLLLMLAELEAMRLYGGGRFLEADELVAATAAVEREIAAEDAPARG
jgi:hypothetical protein